MARPIPMPPQGLLPMEWIFCVKLNEEIEFDVKDPGYFDHLTDGCFIKELPRGYYPAGTIGPMQAVKNGDVVVGYFDDTQHRLFLVTLRVQDTC